MKLKDMRKSIFSIFIIFALILDAQQTLASGSYAMDGQPIIKAAAGTLPIQVLQADDGWCDDVNCAEYNQPVKLPFPGSHEKLWRDDNLYDV